ncbi:MAG: hypothetical protein AAF543_15110 [Pseudomonadota bacterium]
MHAKPMIDDPADDLTPLIRELTSRPDVLRQDLQSLRFALDRHGPIDRRQAAEFFRANRIIRTDQDGWYELYLAALTGFFLKYQEDRFILPEHSAALLLGWLGGEESIADVGERRLTLRLLLRAADVPDCFERRILDAIAEALIHQPYRWSGDGVRTPGVIDALDLHLIGNLACRSGNQPTNRLSRIMVAFLLTLERGPCRFADPAAWRRLLVDCLARHLSQGLMPERDVASASSSRSISDLSALLDECCGPGMDDHLRDEVLSEVEERVASYA